jgi:ribosome maturation factor RimP
LPHPAAADLQKLCESLAPSHGLAVRSVQVFTHRIPMTVQVVVEPGNGGDISLEECAAFSGPLGEAIEAAALLPGAYVLEVSSPGLGEDLVSDRDFVSFRGFPVEIRRRDSSGAESTQAGLLLGRNASSVQLNIRGRTVRIPRDEVLRVHLVTPPGAP